MTAATAAQSFDAWAEDYDRYRPTYPAALYDEIASRFALPASARVADLGAGTGLATLAMARRGWRITAVEPGARMLERLGVHASAGGLEVDPIEAHAEDTGLPTATFDLVTAAQAFHWFDRRRAVDEIARLLRAGGGVALFWNVRDVTRSPLVAEYEGLIGRLFGAAGIGQYLQHGRMAEDQATRSAFAACPAFESLTFTELRQDIDMTADEFVGMASTASYVRTLSFGEQERLREAVRALLARHGADAAPFTVPYRIDLWTARRSDR